MDVFDTMTSLDQLDPEIFAVIKAEMRRQEDHIELIASENYTSPRVMQVQGSALTNKYAEGYPHKRYYGGCEHVDRAEDLAIERAKVLFSADYVNVQPHSGSQANAAVYFSLLQPGDTVLGMDLNAGGHLTHGSKANFSGKLFNVIAYGVDEKTGLISYEDIKQKALAHKPKMIIGGFSAYSQIVDWSKLREIADLVGAYLWVDMAHVAGLVAVGLYPNPIPYADVVTTTTHKTLRGPRGGMILSRQNDTLTKKFNSMVFPGTQGGPLMHVIAAKAVALQEALQPEFRVYQQQVIDNAKAMAAVFLDRGYHVVSGGTENHLFLIDLTDKGMTGKAAEAGLEAANITVNKNTVPGEMRSPFVTSGLRIGTPAITTRRFSRAACEKLAGWMCDILTDLKDCTEVERVKRDVLALCRDFPVYSAACPRGVMSNRRGRDGR